MLLTDTRVFCLIDFSKCCNCKRVQFDTNEESVYHLLFQEVESTKIWRYGHRCQHIHKIFSKINICTYNLCKECYQFLVVRDGKAELSKNTWPGFLWNLLSGGHQPKFGSSYRYHEIYPGKELWQLIPLTMRRWWTPVIQDINLFGVYPYKGCNLTTPEPIFHDKTNILYKREEDCAHSAQARLHQALRNKQVMLSNVLCPFGCS